MASLMAYLPHAWRCRSGWPSVSILQLGVKADLVDNCCLGEQQMKVSDLSSETHNTSSEIHNTSSEIHSISSCGTQYLFLIYTIHVPGIHVSLLRCTDSVPKIYNISNEIYNIGFWDTNFVFLRYTISVPEIHNICSGDTHYLFRRYTISVPEIHDIRS